MAITNEIDEVRFPELISRGAVGGPTFSTIVVASATGIEQRIGQWSKARHKWDVSHALRTPVFAETLMAFFIARAGKLRGFRFKDWRDFQATLETLYPTGASTVQLEKSYTSGLRTQRRPIYKPVQSAGITVLRNTVAFTLFAIDWNSGTLFLTPDSEKVITAITNAVTAVVSSTAHGFLAGDFVFITLVNGMTQINNRTVEILSVNANDFTIDLDTTDYGVYTSGGIAGKYIQPSELLQWTGEFDVPVRFDTDIMNLLQADSQARAWENVPVIELRGCPVIEEQTPPEPPVEGPTEENMLWYFDSDNITPQSDDTDLASWPDAAPVPHDMQFPGTNGGNQPNYRTAASGVAINGHAVVQVADGDQGDIPYPNFSPTVVDQSFTHYWVGRYDTPISGAGVLLYAYRTGGASIIRLYLDGISGANVGYEFHTDAGGPTDVDVAAAVDGVQLITFVFDKTGGTAKVYRNGVQIGSTSVSVGGTGAGNGFDWGDDFIEFFAVAGGIAPAIGEHACLLGYSVAHDDTTRGEVEAILMEKYGL
jgi:uncharacterized protein (TIGR02217 family)